MADVLCWKLCEWEGKKPSVMDGCIFISEKKGKGLSWDLVFTFLNNIFFSSHIWLDLTVIEALGLFIFDQNHVWENHPVPPWAQERVHCENWAHIRLQLFFSCLCSTTNVSCHGLIKCCCSHQCVQRWIFCLCKFQRNVKIVLFINIIFSLEFVLRNTFWFALI